MNCPASGAPPVTSTPITFINRKTAIPGWVNTIHEDHPRSYAYRKGEHLVSLYGRAHGSFTISSGLTVSQKADTELYAWSDQVFGATEIVGMTSTVGHAVAGVWRPGLLFQNHINHALGVTDSERLSADQALGLLIEKLYDLFLYIEPTQTGLAAYGHKTRELLILAATEAENAWRRYAAQGGILAQGGRYTTNDYVRLKAPLFLGEYRVHVKPFPTVGYVVPFGTWNTNAPTQSLPWYEAYNKTKHDRGAHFGEASLARCVEAVAACIVMFAVRFSPIALYEGRAITSSLFNQLFDLSLIDPDPRTFYVPDIDVSERRPDLFCGDGHLAPWVTDPLVL